MSDLKTASPSARFVPAVTLCLALAVLSVYAQTRHFDFLSYDDPLYVKNNPDIRKGLSFHGLGWAFTDSARQTSYWVPVTWLSFLANYEISGEDPAGYHLGNALIHAANTVLLFLALLALTGRAGPAAFAAGLFGLHPMHVESVAWVSERKDMMVGLFWMLSLLAYARYARARTPGRYAAVLALYTLGLMSKPTMVTFPCVLLLLDFWPLGRLGQWPSWQKLRGPVLEKLPFLALALAASAAAWVVHQPEMEGTAFAHIPLATRAASSLIAYLDHVRHALLPVNLSIIYPYDFSPPPGQAALALAVLLAVSVPAVALARRLPFLPVGWFWFLGVLFPTIGLVVIGPHRMADRYAYLPSIGLYILAAYGGDRLFSRFRMDAIPRYAAALPILAVLGAGSLVQAGYWKNDMTVFTRAVEVTQGNWAAHTDLGNALLAHGRKAEAVEQYEKALEIRPNEPKLLLNLGLARKALGRTDLAEGLFRRALAQDPGFSDAWLNLGILLDETGRTGEALDLFRKAGDRFPASPEILDALGLVLLNAGNTEEAVPKFQKALARDPDFASAEKNLGIAFIQRNQAREALAHLSRAVSLAPDMAEAQYALGALLLATGNQRAGLFHLSRVLVLDPDFAEGRDAQTWLFLGQAAESQGNREMAARYFSMAKKLSRAGNGPEQASQPEGP